MTVDQRDIIRRVRIFASLTDPDCDAVLRVIKARRGEVGQVLFKQGEPGNTMIIVAEGELSARVSSAAGETEVARFGVGEVVGEMVVIDPAPRSASVVAIVRTLVYEFSRDGLEELKKTAPGAASALVRAVIRAVTKRLREINARIEQEIVGRQPSASLPPTGRVSITDAGPRSRRPSMMGEAPPASRASHIPTPAPMSAPSSLANPHANPQDEKHGLGKLLDKLRGGS